MESRQRRTGERLYALAMAGERVAGYSSLRFPEQAGQDGYTEGTAVRREHRGQGLANPENGPMLAVNQKLGYQFVPGPRLLRKTIQP